MITARFHAAEVGHDGPVGRDCAIVRIDNTAAPPGAPHHLVRQRLQARHGGGGAGGGEFGLGGGEHRLDRQRAPVGHRATSTLGHALNNRPTVGTS